LRALLARIPDLRGPWLDAPCGAGRMSEELPGPVVQLDYAIEMLAAIEAPAGPRVRASAFALPFADRSFGGVLCHRLLHHVPTSEARVRLLAELARVSEGPMIVSFFHSFCVQHLRRWVSRKWRHKPRSSRGGVTLRTFLCDLREAGLRPVAARPLLPLWSEQWLVLAMRNRTES
jgi:ubiquinone/menaquinone biosynthesis C-methylase UbiE